MSGRVLPSLSVSTTLLDLSDVLRLDVPMNDPLRNYRAALRLALTYLSAVELADFRRRMKTLPRRRPKARRAG